MEKITMGITSNEKLKNRNLNSKSKNLPVGIVIIKPIATHEPTIV
jgi:hypothetical protein